MNLPGDEINPQSEPTTEQALSEEATTPTQPVSTDVDLGDGTKLSLDAIKNLYQKGRGWQEFEDWKTANPAKLARIRAIIQEIEEPEAEPETDEEPTEDNKTSKRLDTQEAIIDDLLLDKEIDAAKRWVESKEIEWTPEVERKILAHISKHGDDGGIKAAKLIFFDTVNQLSAKKKPSPKFTEGRKIATKPAPQDVSKMNSGQRREAMLQELKKLTSS